MASRRAALAVLSGATTVALLVLFPLFALVAGKAEANAGATAEVQIKGNLFVPETITIKAGSTVRWVNKERRTTHSVLFPAEGNLESDRMLPDETWQRRFDKPGRYPYTCGPHPEMKGVVVVVD